MGHFHRKGDFTAGLPASDYTESEDFRLSGRNRGASGNIHIRGYISKLGCSLFSSLKLGHAPLSQAKAMFEIRVDFEEQRAGP